MLYLLNKASIDGVDSTLFDVVIGEGQVRCIFSEDDYTIDVFTDFHGVVHCRERNYDCVDFVLKFKAYDNDMNMLQLDAVEFFNLCMTNSFYITPIKLISVFRLKDIYIILNTWSSCDLGRMLPELLDYSVEVINDKVKIKSIKTTDTLWLNLKLGVTKERFLGRLSKLMLLEE